MPQFPPAKPKRKDGHLDRRQLARWATTGLGASALAATRVASSRVAATLFGAPFLLRGAEALPQLPAGVASGDVQANGALLWSKTDQAARMMARWRREGGPWQQVQGGFASPQANFTARTILRGLPENARIEYEVWFVGEKGNGPRLSGSSPAGPTAAGHLLTPPRPTSPGSPQGGQLRFCWSGDTVGQGYGINPDWGGMRIYETMRQLQPHFFLHSGDTIYADNPVPPTITLPDGSLWKNLTSPLKQKVAETTEEFWGAYDYNLLDANFRRFQAEVPQVWQWDDHEVCNNWSASKDLQNDPRYQVKDIALLAARARKAFLDYAPIGPTVGGNGIYRQLSYGPLLDLFVVDLRSFRGPNGPNRETQESAATTWFGRQQFAWLRQALRKSKAVWKVIAADMPIGLIVGDGKNKAGQPLFENVANGDGPALGRELEMARLLSAIKRDGVKNIVWLTADVHYTAAHHYHPDRAQFKDFTPFWEFVSGPLNAGTFGPGQLENTFGPEVVFSKHPPKGQGNLPPSAGYQFFGEVAIDGESRAMEVRLRDVANTVLFRKTLSAE